jgi:hypothetical protein
MSRGRMGGIDRLKIPLAKLSIRESHLIGTQRLEVNESITRYKNEMKSLASSI